MTEWMRVIDWLCIAGIAIAVACWIASIFLSGVDEDDDDYYWE